ncbi:MRG/MORF4L-binding protein isoform X3 [Loxodonta africana]|uniref:MRG/MORF4L-binding protein isoform X3 n=1 Tax=Loxodonta africana TaxID=9785 RepID=UPI000540671E|nr:MRG/MORF4L-binding protein isoform X3 [Loxodonta africana]
MTCRHWCAQATWRNTAHLPGQPGLSHQPIFPSRLVVLPFQGLCPFWDPWPRGQESPDQSPLHESEILPFPNPERNFVLPEEIIQEVREGKVIIEEEMKEEMKEDVDPHNGADDVFSSSGSLGKAAEKSSKEKEKNSSDLGSKEGADKRKRSRVTDKVLTANSNPSSPSAAKRRRT